MAKILIVEDDQLMSRMYQKVFMFEKYSVDTAGNGEDALVKVHKDTPDLILLDIMMPKMNGLEVLDRLKSDPKTKNIPVVMLTNLASEKDAEAAMLKGAVKYIVKSEHDPKAVVNMVKDLMSAYTRDEIPSPHS